MTTETGSVDIHSESDLVYLSPEDIVIDEISLKSRPLYDPVTEVAEVQELAKSIERDGLLEPVIVRYIGTDYPVGAEDEGGRYHLVAGRRRVDAVNFINSQKAKGEEPFRIPAMVNGHIRTDKDAFRAALAENIKRKDLSAVQFALVMKHVREDNGWNGTKGTKQVAEYLQVSVATVIQYEKILTLPEDVQQLIHRGELSMKAALDLVDVREEKREEVLEKARSGRLEEERSLATQEGIVEETDDETEDKPVSRRKKATRGRIQSKDVRAAARDTDDALERPKSRSRKDIIEWFEAMNGPAYGYENGPIRLFISYFLKWEKGEGTDRGLATVFDRMVEGVDRGTEDDIKEAKTARKARSAAKKPAKKTASRKK